MSDLCTLSDYDKRLTAVKLTSAKLRKDPPITLTAHVYNKGFRLKSIQQATYFNNLCLTSSVRPDIGHRRPHQNQTIPHRNTITDGSESNILARYNWERIKILKIEPNHHNGPRKHQLFADGNKGIATYTEGSRNTGPVSLSLQISAPSRQHKRENYISLPLTITYLQLTHILISNYDGTATDFTQ